MMQKKIAIIGGSYLQLPIVLKANSLGFETHCFSWRDGAVCADFASYFYPISIIEKEEIAAKCEEIGIDAVVSIASDVAVMTVNYVADKLGLIANPVKYTPLTTNKAQMRQVFADNNIPSPKFLVVHPEDKVDAFTFTYPVIVKPTDRSGSRGVTKILAPEDLERAIARAFSESFADEAIIEEFVDGREISVESISFRGEHHVLQITDKVTTGAPYFVELEHHQPSTLSDAIKADVIKIVLAALDALHIQNGASHAELKINAKGEIRIIEIGARMGGDFIGSNLVQLSTGYDFLKGVIDVALGTFAPPVVKALACSGVYFLSKETERLLPLFSSTEEMPGVVEAQITDTTLRRIKESADRSGYIIYQSTSKLEL